jgi:nicotinate-nucleotide adenylyltransferase
VLVVPTLAHAFDKPLTDFEHRLAMTRLAFAPLDGASVSSVERRLGAPSRTLSTLEEILRVEPERRLRLMIGADVLSDRHSWHRWDRIVEVAPPFVLGRAGVASAEAPSPVLPEISSTSVRSLLGATRDGRADDAELARLVPAAVLRYIDSHDLYRRNP